MPMKQLQKRLFTKTILHFEIIPASHIREFYGDGQVN